MCRSAVTWYSLIAFLISCCGVRKVADGTSFTSCCADNIGACNFVAQSTYRVHIEVYKCIAHSFDCECHCVQVIEKLQPLEV